MATFRRQRRQNDIWPGFVDALATLLMVIIFLLMIFVLAQVVLSDLLSGKDKTLARLNTEIKELAELLVLERRANVKLSEELKLLDTELSASVAERDSLESQITAMTGRINSLVNDLESTRRKAIAVESEVAGLESNVVGLESNLVGLQADKKSLQEALARYESLSEEDKRKLEAALRSYRTSQIALEKARAEAEKLRQDLAEKDRRLLVVSRNLEDAYKTIEADKEKVKIKLKEIAALIQQVEALQALKRSLESQMAERARELTDQDKKTLEALGQVALLNEQVRALREQMAVMKEALDLSKRRTVEQAAEIDTLTAELNKALLSEVNKLKGYRSDFFGRLRKLMGERKGIQIVGDRFVFQSEVLFGRGSDEIEPAGRAELQQVADILNELAPSIPDDIDWVLRVDGHTDNTPIATARFPSNWELSTARAISVVRFFMSQGIPPARMAATGFGEYHPLEDTDDPDGLARNRRIEIKLTQR